MRVTDLSDELGRWPDVAPRARAHDLHAVLAVPMQAGAHTVGALQLTRVGPGAFTHSDASTAEALADMVADAISHGRAMHGLSAGRLNHDRLDVGPPDS